ncbi:type I glyceraldehyde-3-phosphate dehydrogenase [Candidatus Deianiraea vastatrix]|uniref:Glyceraldehyde-3-phosphate dehydrogenase n=2 Tax=Candidatus Deianiraea vastatrix TaxID=2163644 RepID=A0A5B8XDR8_9RICK|nr:Glyceraldehyde-3-phosphate dehydrogenase [Candidatus Deianiraea vastatrix]
MKIAINGFGRIGRCVFRAYFENEKYKNLDICKVNSSLDMKTSLHLLQFDSIFGRFSKKIDILSENKCKIEGKTIEFISEKDPGKINWSGIDIVMECTGVFTEKKKAEIHISSGAKKVMISAPAKEKDVPTIVYGINNHELTPDISVFSIGSCTTNCLAPIAKILDDEFKIVNGFMTTIHSYTGDQNIVDGSHKDLRRARAAAVSMVPTSTGAAKALSLVLPNLEGKLDGSAIRVPTPNVSVVDLVVNVEHETSVEAVNSVFKKYAQNSMSEILEVEERPLVSCDFVKSAYSSNFDALETKVVGKKCIRVLAWYDNEWGFSNRMLDLALLCRA